MKEDKEKKEKEQDSEKTEKELEEEINKFLSEMGVSRDDVKIVAIKIPKRTPFYCIMESLFFLIANIILITSGSTVFRYADGGFLNVLYISLIYSFFEIVFRNVMCTFWKKSYFKFGLAIDMLCVALSTVLTYTIPLVTFNTPLYLFLVATVIYCVLRQIIKKHTFDVWMDKVLTKIAKKK